MTFTRLPNAGRRAAFRRRARAGVGACLACGLLAGGLAAASAADTDVFRVRPYLQHPAPDAMTVRWFTHAGTPGTLTCDGRSFTSRPILCHDLDYQPSESSDGQFTACPYLHSVRIDGLEPSMSYPYEVVQDGQTVRAVLTTSPRPGEVGRGGGVRLFFYSDARARPESRSEREPWKPTVALPGGPRPRWARTSYPVERTVAYRTNLALIAARTAESLRAGNPALVSIVGDLVESGGEQRHWDEFWRHNAGSFGTLAARVPIVAAPGDRENYGGTVTDDPLTNRGGFFPPITLFAIRKFLTYFEHPSNDADDERHDGRYFRLDFGPVTLLSLDTNNGGTDGGADDTNLELARGDALHIPDYAPGSPQHDWLVRELAAARDRGSITFVQFHHAAFSSGPHGRPAGTGDARDEHSGRPLRAFAGLFRDHGVRAVFSGHDQMYEHSAVDGVHWYTVGIGGAGLPEPHPAAVNDARVFLAHDNAAERWQRDVLEAGGRHYGHVEVDVIRSETGGGFTVTITPVHIFPVLSPDQPGEVIDWERRVYDDVVSFDVAAPAAVGTAE
jgi:hypothetical protein